MTEQQIRDSLPVPPFRYKYRIIQQSAQVWRVDLIHPMVYHYSDDVWTVWGFIKSGKVYPPASHKKARRAALCALSEIPDNCDYTTIRPTTHSLLHLK